MGTRHCFQFMEDFTRAKNTYRQHVHFFSDRNISIFGLFSLVNRKRESKRMSGLLVIPTAIVEATRFNSVASAGTASGSRVATPSVKMMAMFSASGLSSE